jgi:hypothetical protein
MGKSATCRRLADATGPKLYAAWNTSARQRLAAVEGADRLTDRSVALIVY